MKKMLALMLFFGMASAAGAALQISVDGNPDPVDSQITIAPSDYLTLNIHATGGDTGIEEGQTIYFALVCDMLLGTVDGSSGVTLIPPAPDASMLMGWAVAENMIGGIPQGWEGIAGTVGSYTLSPPYPDGVYFDEISFHCEGEGDAVIQLMEVDMNTWATTGVVWDSVVIHQIPEPATLALLGLGGLLLRRRK